MENNLIYSSVDEVLVNCSIFVVDIEENETSIRLELRGEYSLKVGDGGLCLLTLNTDKTLFTWPYTVLRRYGTSKTGFTFEAGRKSQAGPGVLRFASPSGKLITQTIKQYVSRIKGGISVPNTESLILGSSLKTNTPQGEVTGDYTEYSRTTGRPHRPVPKLADPHRELSLELPREYINHRIQPGPTLSQPVNVSPQLPLHRVVSPNHVRAPQQVVSPSRSSYNTVGNNAILVDSYSELPRTSPQLANVSLNQAVPLPHNITPPTIMPTNPFFVHTPTKPLPYNSLLRPQAQQQALKEKDSTITNVFNIPCETNTSTFPVCVSPVSKPDSGEESSDEDLPVAGRKISQATESDQEMTTYLSLTTIQESASHSEDYINLKKNSLVKAMSNPIDTDSGDFARPITAPNYLNVRQMSSKISEDDYYNITPEMLEKDRKRSNTDLTTQLSTEKEREKLHFSVTPGPLGVSSFEDLFRTGDQEVLYGSLQLHPSADKPSRGGLYINTPPISKPAYQNVTEYKQTNVLREQPSTSVSQTLPNSPTKSCLTASISQPSTIRIKSRAPREEPVSSQYSFLAEVLGGAPRVPQAYDTWKSQNSANQN